MSRAVLVLAPLPSLQAGQHDKRGCLGCKEDDRVILGGGGGVTQWGDTCRLESLGVKQWAGARWG